jgi:hypothetical protein
MSNEKEKRHTSKNKKFTKKTYLPQVQKKILLHLANTEPKTINETAKAVKSHYKSTWNAFKKLEEKKLVNTVGSKSHQGQEFPCYWVSADGAFVAQCEGAKAKNLIEKSKQIYPDRKDLHYLLESISILGTEAFEKGYLALINKGKLEQNDITAMLLTQIQVGLSQENLLKYVELLKQYPENQPSFKKFVDELMSNMLNLNEQMQGLKPKKTAKKKRISFL